jgi:gamma-glutamylcyclotransferase (GGCT)/AIG2-like uncharacterized protein YtfP
MRVRPTYCHLFVYGTLLPDHAPAEIANTLKRLRVVGGGRVRGRLYNFGDYPGAIVTPSASSCINGLVYEIPVNTNLLRELDAYEGYDERHPERSLFLRKRRMITLDDDRKVLSWVYEYNSDPGDAVYLPGGTYSVRRRSRRTDLIDRRAAER